MMGISGEPEKRDRPAERGSYRYPEQLCASTRQLATARPPLTTVAPETRALLASVMVPRREVVAV